MEIAISGDSNQYEDHPRRSMPISGEGNQGDGNLWRKQSTRLLEHLVHEDGDVFDDSVILSAAAAARGTRASVGAAPSATPAAALVLVGHGHEGREGARGRGEV